MKWLRDSAYDMPLANGWDGVAKVEAAVTRMRPDQDIATETRSSASADSAPGFSPVLRYGTMVASFTLDGARLAFRASAMDAAIAAVKRRADEFHEALSSFLTTRKWDVRTASTHPELGLSKMRTNRRIGAVVDFDELHMAKEGQSFVFRLCVTVCVDSRRELPNECLSDDGVVCTFDPKTGVKLYSKLWCRFAPVEYAGKVADNLTLADHKVLFAALKAMNDELVAACLPTYETCVRDLAKRTDLRIQKVYEINSTTMSTPDAGFSLLYDRAALNDFRWTEESAASVPNRLKSSVRDLFSLRDALVLARDPPVSIDKVKLWPVDFSEFTSGLYWLVVEESRMLMVGLAYDPFLEKDADSDMSKLFSWRSAPSNVLSVFATNKIASRL